MKYSEAQTEFQIRLYRWATMAQEKEIKELFPSFRYVDKEFARKFHFFQSLDLNSQTILGQGLLQTRHQQAVKVLGETISPESETLMRREEAFRRRWLPGTWDGAYAPRNEPDHPPQATRKQLKKAIRDHFRPAFGDRCLPPDPLAGKADMLFGMKCHSWTIETDFGFGRWSPEVRQEHSVWTGKRITKEQPAVLFANCIGFRLNYGNEIGIGSGWENITVENIESTCAEIIGHCRRMFDVFPRLLEGLDLELLTT